MKILRGTVLVGMVVSSLWIGRSQTTVTQASEPESDTEMIMQAIESTPPVPANKTPTFGTFYSAQFGEQRPPFPGNVLNLPFWAVGDGFYIMDDRGVDYDQLQAEAEAAALLSELSGGSSSAMSSRLLNTAIAYGNPVYLTNMAAVLSGSDVTAGFTVVGGTNNVPYDILTTTNLTNSVSQWNWLGIGYSSNSYSFPIQSPDFAFYALAKPQKTMVVGWGNDEVGQCDVWSGLSNAVQAAGGLYHSIVLLSDGTVSAWGDNAYGQGSVPTNLPGATAVAAGWYHNVALLTNGTVTAWGLNFPPFGYTMTNVPPGLSSVMVISAQALHSVALRSNGTVVAWGYNGAGQTNVPAGLTNVVAISAGVQHNLAALSNGTVTAWGGNSSGQCTVPLWLSNVVDVSAGVYHSLALRQDGTVVAWGGNTYGETNVPSGLSNVVAIAAGGYTQYSSSYSLALKSDGTVVKWGSGEVLDGVGGFSNVIAISGGAFHALAIRTGPRTPVITLEPTDQYQVPGGSVTFTSRGAGVYGVAYQWQTNGVNIPGATSATLSLANVQASHQLQYNVLVSNEEGSILSSNANFYLVTAPSIISQTPLPTNQTVVFHKYLTLSVTSSDPLGQSHGFPLSYQWQLNGVDIGGANSNSYPVFGETTNSGIYSVRVSNAAGSASASWQVTMTYTGSYVAPGTLAYYLSTNTAAYATGHSPADEVALSNWTYGFYTNGTMALLTNAVWSTSFWLHGVRGLTATSIGISNNVIGTNKYYGTALMVTMVSPRHYLRAHHTATPGGMIAFLDTNNVIYWRTSMQQVDIGTNADDINAKDTSVGILNAELPPSVGYILVLDTNYPTYLPTNALDYVQGIGMNQDAKVFSQPTLLTSPTIVWDSTATAPFALSNNWNVPLRGGDSSDPERLIIANQFILVSQHHLTFAGPNLAAQFDEINQKMHYLSTNNGVADYQLTYFALTNWPTIR